MNNWKSLSRMMLVALLALAGCYPQGIEFTEDADVVFTNYNSKFDFSAKATYAIPDKIVKITGNAQEGDAPKYIPDILAIPMLNKMKENMTKLGYSEVPISSNPDLILAPAAWETTTITYWYDYWGWYWGGYYPGWGYPYYPYYPTYVSSYSTGTLVMIIIDPDVVSGSGNPVGQWTGAANGILTYTYDAARINSMIDQAFNQSPYLKTN